MILTELMTCSLYDILEVQQLKLDIPEMLEIMSDVMRGIAFLHSQTITFE